MPDSVTSQLGSFYDQVPYDSHPFPQTAPEQLEAVAFMFGLDAPPPAGARVLELGCAAGANLIPFAARHPHASAVGIDLSPVQVAQGAAAIERVGLTNITLHAMDLAGMDAAFGEFDYIICHGVYSWVPPSVQDAILRICADHLAPGGVAYISYNVYPGWKSREIVRDAMLLRGGPRETPQDKLAYARGMLDFLAQSARADSVLKKALDELMPLVRSASTAYLLHEFLEPCNAPCYFKDFVARAEGHALAYLAEAEPWTMFVQNYAPDVREPLLRECGSSQVVMEQYLDFLVDRAFRQTLLVRQALAPSVRYRLDAARLRAFEFAATMRTEDGADFVFDATPQRCVGLRGVKFTLGQPVHKAVARALDDAWPATMPVASLQAEVAARLQLAPAASDAAIMAMLEELLILGAVRVRRGASDIANHVPPRPRALASVRQAPQRAGALDGRQSVMVCNQWHENVELSVLESCVLAALDGKADRVALANHLDALAEAGRIHFQRGGVPLAPLPRNALAAARTEQRVFVLQQVDSALQSLQRKGLICAG